MKVLLAVTVLLLVSGSQANILEGFKEEMEKAGKFFEETLGKAAEEGSKLFQKAFEEANNNINNAQQAIWEAMKKVFEGTAAGKRSVGASAIGNMVNKITSKGKEALENAKNKLQQVYQNAINRFQEVAKKLTGMDFICKVKDTIENLNKEIEDITESHTRSARNILDNLPEWLLKQLENMLGDLAQASLDKIQEALGSLLGKRDLDQHKRLLDTLAQIGKSIGDFFKPHVDNIIEGVKQMGNSLKDAAGKALEGIKGHVNTLGEKLKGHVDELKNHGEQILGHGANALNALKDAVGDIINQAVGNIGDNVKGIIDTGKDAGKVIGEHINGGTY